MRTTMWRRRGAEAVEFALVLPVFVTMTLGAIEFMWFLALSAVLQTAVDDGARAGAVSATEVAVAASQTQALSTWRSFGLPSGAAFLGSTQGAAPNLRLQVTGTLTYTSLTGMLPPSMLPATVVKRTTRHMEDQVP